MKDVKDTKEIKDMLQTLSKIELISLIARQLSRPPFVLKKEDILWVQWITEHDKRVRLCKKQRQMGQNWIAKQALRK